MLNRALQLAILERLAQEYPTGGVEFEDLPGDDTDARLKNLHYLGEHGLCEAGLHPTLGGQSATSESTITAAGMDFQADDGGLTAILGVVTVKLHADTIQALLAAKVDASDLPPEKKSAIKDAIKKMPVTALTMASTDLVKLGLDHAPDAAHWIARLVGLG